MKGSLKKPGIAHAGTTIPVGGSGKTVPGFECWFDKVQENVGSYDMKVLTTGTWTHVTEKTNVGARFPPQSPARMVLARSRSSLEATLTIKLSEKQLKLMSRNMRLMMRRSSTILVVDWDKDITTAYNNKTKAKAPTLPICEQSVYLFGGKNHNPDDLVMNVAHQIVAKAADFHSKPAGAKPDTSQIRRRVTAMCRWHAQATTWDQRLKHLCWVLRPI